MQGYIAQPRYRENGLGPTSSDMTEFVDSPWEILTFTEEWMGMGWGKLWEAGGGMEREMGLVCKTKKLIYKIKTI